jgi:hypothetical protein
MLMETVTSWLRGLNFDFYIPGIIALLSGIHLMFSCAILGAIYVHFGMYFVRPGLISHVLKESYMKILGEY